MKHRTLFATFCAMVVIVLGLTQESASQTLGPRRGVGGIEPDPRPLSFEVSYFYRPGGRGALEPLTEGAMLRSGDHYKIQFTPEEDSYVYIFQVDSSGALYQLFPMESFKGVAVNNFNPVKAGVIYHLPARDKAFQLDEQVGTEVIYFLAFRSQAQAVESQVRRLEEARQRNEAGIDPTGARSGESLIRRGVAGIVDDPQRAAPVPGGGEAQPSMPAGRLDGLCAGCVSVMSFEHR